MGLDLSMNYKEIVLRRLWSQGLSSGRFSSAEEVVRWMGCVQAQDFGMAKRGVEMRVAGAFSSGAVAVDAAYNAGTILRTHVLRPTWHFVLPADIGWMLRLSAPRIRAFSKPYHRQLSLDPAVFRRSRRVLEKALADGVFLTRAEIVTLFKEVKIDTSDIRMNFLLMDAELEGLICSGPRRGKQFTYALLADRVVRLSDLSGDEALGELARRYFVSRGPATVNDLAWWGGMTLGDARRGLEVVKGELECVVVDGVAYWAGASVSAPGFSSTSVILLPAFDELTVAYKDRSAILPVEYAKASSYGLKPVIVVNGRIVGIWRRVTVKGKVVVEPQFFEKVGKAVLRLVEGGCKSWGK